MSNRTHLVVMPGDGIGPEIVAATLHVLREVDRLASLGLTFEEVPIGFPALKAHGTTLPDSSFEAGKRADGVILGPVSHNDYPPAAQGGLNPSGEMRKRLDLYANIRPAKSRPGLPPRCGKPVDLVVVRENTEGFYADRNMFMGSRRVHADAGRGAGAPQDHAERLDADRRDRVQARHAAAAEEGHRRAQGQRAAHHRRAVPGMRARGGEELSAGRVRGADHGRDGGAAGARRQPLRRDPRHQRVRRHPVRRGVGDFRQPRPCRLDQRRKRARAGAGAARLGARHRRQGRRQSGLADRLGGDAAGLARRAAQRRQVHQGRRHDRARARCQSSPSRNGARPISAARSAPRRSASGSRRPWRI